MAEDAKELFDRQDSRLAPTLRYVLHPYETDGIGLVWDQFPSHRTVEDHPHLILQVSFALWCKVESLEPLFDCQRLDLLQRVLAPFGFDVIL